MPESGKKEDSSSVAAAVKPVPPSVTWAQRKDVLLVSIVLSDVKDVVVDFKPDQVHFSGKAGPDQKPYAVDMELYSQIEPEKCKYVVHDRLIDITLQKKDVTAKFWPRFLKSTAKAGWLKTDFSRWKDEDDEEENSGGMGGMGGGMDGYPGGMGGMGGFGGGGDGGGDLESMMQQMGGMGAGGGMGGYPGMGGSDEEDDDIDDTPSKPKGDNKVDDEDEMPKLE